MSAAKSGDTVRVHYTGSFSDGAVFDSSIGGNPLEFTLGQKQVIQGFESVVLGMNVGESRHTLIPCDQAYGPALPEMIFEIERSNFPPDLQITLGLELGINMPNGQVTPVKVVGMDANKIRLDANHPLAGKDLNFKIELIEIVGMPLG
jgi:FKBP-type peptidyl-prolyl cis-trans isomerase 2